MDCASAKFYAAGFSAPSDRMSAQVVLLVHSVLADFCSYSCSRFCFCCDSHPASTLSYLIQGICFFCAPVVVD